MTGKLITFEGIDGSGKTTQIDLLESELKQQGISTLVLREPGGTKLSEKIRGILLDRDNIVLSPLAESLLFVAARTQLMAEKIKPALELDQFVICARFADSRFLLLLPLLLFAVSLLGPMLFKGNALLISDLLQFLSR